MSHDPPRIKSQSLQRKLDQQKSQSLQRKLDQEKTFVKTHQEDFVVCELCRRRLRQPKTLPCLHSFCADCLKKYLKQAVSNTTSPQRLITCPICLQTSEPPAAGRSVEERVDHLPTNEFLASYLEAVELKDSNRQCDTCSRQQKSSLAKQWCSYCHDALCNDCVGFHNALKTTHGHNLIALSHVRQMQISDIISEPLCRHHEGETVTHYCENHQEIICEKCLLGSHKDCRHVKPLKNAAQKYKPDIAQITETLDDEAKLAKSINSNRTVAESDLNATQVELLQKIQAVRQKINENLSKCESQIIGELHDICARDKAAIQSEMKEAQRMRKSASKVHNLVENTDKNGSDSHRLQAVPPSAGQANHYKGKLLSLNGNIKNTKIDFIVDPILEKAMNVNQLGELRVNRTRAEVAISSKLRIPERRADSDPEDEYDFLSRRSKDEYDMRDPDTKSMKSIKSKRSIIKSVRMNTSRQSLKPEKPGSTDLVSSFNGRTSTDLDTCWFTGVEYLHDGRIIVVDRNNYKIKVFGTDHSLQTEVKLQHQPFGLTLMSASEFAVTIPRENKIEIFSLSGMTLTPSSTVQTSERCYGISYDGMRFFVACACASPPSIKVILFFCIFQPIFPKYSET